jgi:replicative DNA helicase
MLRTKDHVTPAARGVCKEMFHGYRDAYEWIESYIARHRRTPSTGAFREAFGEVVLKKVDDVELYIEKVRERHSSIVLKGGLQDVIRKLNSGDVNAAIKQLHSASVAAEASLMGHSNDTDIFRDFGDIKDEAFRRKKKADETGFAGIPTGFPTLDDLTGGIQPGWFVVISARAGVGKTRSLIRMACAAAFSGFTVMYDALEQTRSEIAFQVHAFGSSEFGKGVIRSLDLAKGKGFETKGYYELLETLRDNVKGKFHVADSTQGTITPATIPAQIEKHKPDIVFLDFLTLMEGTEDHQSAANTSTAIKRVAQHYKVPIVTAAQINRMGAGSKNQGLETLAVTDRLGQDADLVINVQQLSRSVIVMEIIKFRHGPDGYKFYLKFDPNHGVMEEITYEQAMDLKDIDDNEMDNRSAEKQKKFVPRQRGSFHKAAVASRSKSLPEAKKIPVKSIKLVNGSGGGKPTVRLRRAP